MINFKRLSSQIHKNDGAFFIYEDYLLLLNSIKITPVYMYICIYVYMYTCIYVFVQYVSNQLDYLQFHELFYIELFYIELFYIELLYRTILYRTILYRTILMDIGVISYLK